MNIMIQKSALQYYCLTRIPCSLLLREIPLNPARIECAGIFTKLWSMSYQLQVVFTPSSSSTLSPFHTFFPLCTHHLFQFSNSITIVSFRSCHRSNQVHNDDANIDTSQFRRWDRGPSSEESKRGPSPRIR